MEIEETDLRGITRDSDKCQTTVYLMERFERNRIKWLILGEVHFCRQDGYGRPRRWMLHAWLRDGATDFEHDSVYAIKIPLVGVEFDGVEHQNTSIFGYVDPDQEENFAQFHVPRPGYDPFAAEGVTDCSDCHEQLKKFPDGDYYEHKIIPESMFVPEFDAELYGVVKGKPVMINIGPAPELWGGGGR